MTDLSELAARIEAAEGPSYALEIEIAGAMGRPVAASMPAYTASVDAALMLVPEGWHTFLVTEDRHSHSWRWELRGGYGLRAAARAATPALALACAALRAKEVSDHG